MRHMWPSAAKTPECRETLAARKYLSKTASFLEVIKAAAPRLARIIFNAPAGVARSMRLKILARDERGQRKC